MIEFFRKVFSSPQSSPSGVPPLIFKDGAAALEYACKYLNCPLHEGAFLPGLVVDSREQFGTEHAVQIQSDGNQLAMLRLASSDGGFIVPATTAGPSGPRLRPGQLVAWQAMKHMPELGSKMGDERSGWVGLIVGTLKPEHRNQRWVVDETFSP